jgi:carbon-monoxide dehydrogenase large subunit
VTGAYGSLPRKEDARFIRGKGIFVDDIALPGMLHGAVLRSPLPHARIRSIDTAAAEAHPRVEAVITGETLAARGLAWMPTLSTDVQAVLATDKVRFQGQEVAFVVAEDRYSARDALELIDVEYEPLEAVLDPEAGEVVHERSFSYGDPDAAFAAADLVVEGRYAFPRWTSCPIECYGVVADWNDATGVLTAWANFQGPFTLHSVAAGALGLPGSKLRLITPPDSGGSFGIKSAVFGKSFKLTQRKNDLGHPEFTLSVR